MTPLTLPQARIPLGWVMVDGKRVPVEIDMEWMRAFLVLVDRSGGITGGNSFEAFLPLLLAPPSDPAAQEAVRSVDEVRNEMGSTRGDLRQLLARIEDVESELMTLRPAADLRSRVEQIEDRLQ